MNTIDPARLRIDPHPLASCFFQRERERKERDGIETSSCRINNDKKPVLQVQDLCIKLPDGGDRKIGRASCRERVYVLV